MYLSAIKVDNKKKNAKNMQKYTSSIQSAAED